MLRSKPNNVIAESPSPNIRIVRFTRPDLREQFDEGTNPMRLRQELQAFALEPLQGGQTLILNLGMVEWFPSAFYSLLLWLRAQVLARGAQLVLCRLSPEQRELFELFNGFRLFQVTKTESLALRQHTQVN